MERQLVPKGQAANNRKYWSRNYTGAAKQEDPYSLSYSILGEAGEIQTKKLTVSATDLRLGRVCLARADITDSVRKAAGVAECGGLYI